MNNPAFSRKEINLDDLHLDIENPRLRAYGPEDDRACLEALVEHKPDQMYALAKDIFENGLSIEPIVVIPDDVGYIVKDGNRRIACLKMLRNPDEAPAKLRSRIKRIVKDANGMVPETVECACADDVSAVNDYLVRRHGGVGSGEGHLDWDALEKAFFEYSLGIKGQNDLAVKLILHYAVPEGIDISSDFSITTLTRLLNIERLKKLGIADVNSKPAKLVKEENPDIVRERIKKIINDIDTGVVNVTRGAKSGSIISQDDQGKYINEVLSTVKAPTKKTGGSKNISSKQKDADGNIDDSGKTVSSNIVTRPIIKKPSKPAWDRSRVIANSSDALSIPTDCKKAVNIQAELRRLNVDSFPNAASLLVRALWELSIGFYLNKHNIKHESTRKDIKACAKHLFDTGKIDKDFREKIVKYADNNHYISIDTLHAYVHDDSYHPNKQSINTLWDEAREFLDLLWKA